MPTEIERKACSLPVVFGAYILVLLVTCGVGYALMWATIATADSPVESKREKTVLDERVATAQEIKALLSKPQLPIEPLPPVTANVANSHPTNVVGMDGKQKFIQLSKEARGAFAMNASGSSSGSSAGYNRSGTGGW
jgi:hypothetical protein